MCLKVKCNDGMNVIFPQLSQELEVGFVRLKSKEYLVFILQVLKKEILCF